jgi:hypothetical protein
MNKFGIAAVVFFATMTLSQPSTAGSVPFDSITRTIIAHRGMIDTIIDGSNNVNNAIPTGAIVFYTTKTGHLGKLKVLSYGYNMWLKIVTYNNDGSVLAQADSVQVGGTFFCDLDSAKESTLQQSDFQWEIVNATIRQMTAIHPVKLSIYYSPNNVVTNISIITPSPAIINKYQFVNIKFTYITSMANGAKIFCKPISAGPNGPITLPSAHYSLLTVANAGTDSATGDFFFDSGSVFVDSVYFLMLDSSRARTLFEGYIPVSYAVAADTTSNLVIPASISPQSPASLADKQHVTMKFFYRTVETAGVRIFCEPFAGGSFPPHTMLQGSPIIKSPSDTMSRYFSIDSGTTQVDSVRFWMTDSTSTKTFFETYLPVSYSFTDGTGAVALSNKSLSGQFACTALPGGTVRIEMPEAGFAEIKAYDARGRCLGIMAHGYLTAGEHVMKMGKVRGVAVVRGKVKGREFVSKVIAGE